MPTTQVSLGLIDAPGSYGFRNRIINGGMGVWQRGTSFSGNGYTADRWYAGNSPSSVVQSSDAPAGQSLSLDITGANHLINQRIESANAFDLASTPVTVSFWAKSVSGTNTLSVQIGTPSAVDNFAVQNVQQTSSALTLSSSWTHYTIAFSALPSSASNGVFIYIYRNGSTATDRTRITGVQLEAGSVATPFERRDYGREVMMCQRYYYRVTGNGYSYLATGQVATSTQVVVWTPFPVTFRAVPTSLEQTGTASNYGISQANTTVVACTSVPIFNAATLAGASSVFTSSSLGGTAGQATFGVSNNTSAAFLAWSVEL